MRGRCSGFNTPKFCSDVWRSWFSSFTGALLPDLEKLSSIVRGTSCLHIVILHRQNTDNKPTSVTTMARLQAKRTDYTRPYCYQYCYTNKQQTSIRPFKTTSIKPHLTHDTTTYFYHRVVYIARRIQQARCKPLGPKGREKQARRKSHKHTSKPHPLVKTPHSTHYSKAYLCMDHTTSVTSPYARAPS